MRCKAPIEPVEFSRRVCQDASTIGHGGAQARYLNRLTPVSVIVKAVEGTIEEAARQTLATHFKLKPKDVDANADSAAGHDKTEGKEAAVNEEIQPATVSSCMSDFTILI